MTDGTIKTPWHLWVVGVIAVLFNAIGVFDFVMTMAKGAAYLASAGLTPAQVAHYAHMPAWVTVDWAVGVFGAFIGSALILLRNKLAWQVLAVSLAAYLLNLLYTYVLSDGGKLMGPQMGVMSVVIAGQLVVFMAYGWWMARRGVLR